MPPCPPSLRLWCYAMKIKTFSENKQIIKSERHEHLQFSNTISHGSCADCQQRLLAAFQVSSCSFVSLPCLPHAFLRRGPVFVSFSDIQQVTFLRLDKFENNFWIVLEVRFRSVNVPVSLGNGENEIYPKCVWLSTVFVKKVTWAVGSSLLCSQCTSGWTCPWAPPKKNPGSAYETLLTFKKWLRDICAADNIQCIANSKLYSVIEAVPQSCISGNSCLSYFPTHDFPLHHPDSIITKSTKYF